MLSTSRETETEIETETETETGMTQNSFRKEEVAALVDGVSLTLSVMVKDGDGDPIVFLHGFGSTKEDYADIARLPSLLERPILA